jgi:hypothetical protein
MAELYSNPNEWRSATIAQTETSSVSRRDVIKTLSLGIPASVLLATGKASSATEESTSETGRTPAADVYQRTIPRTGERLPVVGLGTFMTFDSLPGQDRESHMEVVRRFWQALTPPRIAIRPVALSRKNWLHFGSQEAGPRIATILSVVYGTQRHL